MNIQGKTILITGGASGIGLEAVKQFLANGAKVIITGRNQGKLDEAKKRYPAITVIQSDVANADDVRALFEQITALGGIDILYNNAGINATIGSKPLNFGVPNDRHFVSASDEMSINYLGVIRMNNTFMAMLASRPEAAIINTSSILSYVPANVAASYSASKVATRFYTEALQRHLKLINSSVKVFELLPPLVATDMAEGFESGAITPEKLVNGLVAGLKKNTYTIRVGMSKIMHIISRLSPRLASKLLNQPKINAQLK